MVKVGVWIVDDGAFRHVFRRFTIHRSSTIVHKLSARPGEASG
jgi:hypothetical protein